MIPSSALSNLAKNQIVDTEVAQFQEAIRYFLQRVVSTIRGKDTPVEFTDQRSDVVGFTDGTTIFIGKHLVRDIADGIRNRNFSGKVGAVAGLKALAFHELSHILWSPRFGKNNLLSSKSFVTSELVQWDKERYGLSAPTTSWADDGTAVITPALYPSPRWVATKALNVIEDARIEMLFLSRYRAATPYFVNLVHDQILRSGKDALGRSTAHPLAFLLLYGRKYIDRSIVDSFEVIHDKAVDKFRSLGLAPLDTAQVKDLIDEFLTLDLVHNESGKVRAVELTKWFVYHLENMETLESPNRENWGGGGSSTLENNDDLEEVRHDSTTATATKTREDLKKTDELLEELESESEEDSDSDSDADADADADADGDSDGDSDGSDGSGDGKSESDDNADSNDTEDGQPDSTDNTPDSSTAGTAGATAGGDDELLKDALDKLKNQANESLNSIGNSDTQAIADIVNEGIRPDLRPDLRGSKQHPLAPNMKIASKSIARSIQKVWADGEPAWIDDQTSGRLNSKRLLRSEASEYPDFRIFNRWQDVGDSNDFELVVLVDQSSSMNTDGRSYGLTEEDLLITQVSQATWVLRDACRELGIPITVFGYNSTARCLFRSTDKGDAAKYTVLHATGGTDPTQALKWASSVFKASKAHHKLLFSLTDGDWGGGGRAAEHNAPTIYMRHVLNVHTFFCLMTGKSTPLNEHHARVRFDNLYSHEHYVPVPVLAEFPKSVSRVIERLSNK